MTGGTWPQMLVLRNARRRSERRQQLKRAHRRCAVIEHRCCFVGDRSPVAVVPALYKHGVTCHHEVDM